MTIPGDIVLPENPPTKPSPRPPLTLSTADEGPYGKQIDERAQTQQSNLQQSTFVAGQRNDPARWAKVLDIARRLKVNPSFVDQNYETLTKTDAENRITAQAGNSPTLAQWLQNPDNATISKDELPALSKVDQGVRALIPPVPIPADASVVGTIPRAPAETPYQTGFQSVFAGEKPRDWEMDLPHAALTGYNDTRAAAGQLAVAYGLVSPDHAAEWVAGVNKRSAELRAQEPLYAKEYSASMAEHRQAIDAAVRGAPAFGRGKVLEALKGYATGNVKTVGELLGMLGSAIMNPSGFVYSTVESLPGMAPALAGGAGGAAVGGLPGLIGGTFIGMAPLNVGSEINAELAKRGYDITKPDDLRRAYSDPALMADIRGRAARAGVTSAAVSSLVASFAGGLTARAEATGAGAVGRTVATAGDVAVQAGGQGVAQLAGQVAGEKGDLSKVSLGAAAETAISMLGYGIGETAIGASRRGLFHADPVEAATQATTQASEALKVVHDAQALAQIGVALKEAPVTSTVPDRVRSLIETATGGDPARAVYFQEADWNSYWQSKGESPAKAAADIMGDAGKAYDEARTTGAPLAIPLGDYISRVATTDHFEGLLNVARTEPGGMSLGEAHEYLQGLPATLGEIAKEAENAPVDVPPTTIQGTIAQKLESAGRSPAEAKALAQVYEQAFSTLGRRAGIDPQLLFDRYQLEVNKGGEAPRTVSKMEQAAWDKENAIVGQSVIAKGVYEKVASEIMAHPEERRKMLLDAFRAQPDMLDLQQGERGRFRINPETRQAVIDLFNPADRSTFLHETGHFYLEVLGDLATAEKASPDISKDYSSILTWLGVENRTQIGKAQHEQFARGFEAYLMEGKAPSSALREAFFRFKNWLTRIYKEVGNLNANISPEVRAVFDRILASDEEIRQAQAEQVTTPLFDDPRAVGMTDEQAQQFSQAVAEANQAASEELTTKMMRELRREESKDWKALKEIARSAVEAEAEKNPILRALSLLTRGKTPLGSELPEGLEPFKLSRQAIVDDFGKARLESLPRPYVYSSEGGVHPDAAAEALGFKSGDELLTALSNSPKPSDWIAQETNRRMQAEHGERLSELQIRQAAATAVRGEKQIQLLRKTLEILASDQTRTFLKLAEKVNGAVPPTEELRVQADKIIGEKSVKDIRPILYERAAAAQAKLAQELFRKGDIQGAFDAKRKELLATEVLRSAEDAKSQIQEGLADFRKVYQSDTKLAKTRDMDLINAARSVLSSFEIGSAKGSPDSYLKQLREYDPEMAQVVNGIVNDLSGNAQNYKDMPFADFAFLRESINGLWNMARRVTQIEVDGQKVDRVQVRDELIARAESLRKPGELPGYKKAVTGWEQTKISLLAFKAVSRRIEHWIRGFDGGEAQGIGRKYLWNRISDAATAFRAEKKATITEYSEFLKGLKATDLPISRAKIPAPEIDYTFSGHNELLGALLHTGNESNLQKLLVGRGWGAMEEHTIGPNKTVGILDTSKWDALTKRLRAEGVLTKGHYDFVQGVWDRFEGLKPGAQKAHKDQFGRYFSELTHQQFTNEYGTYEGGYYPAKVDPNMVPDAEARADHDALLGSNTSFMYPSVGRGFTKERVENYRKPLLLDASAVPQHFDAVLRFTHLGPAVRDVARVIMDPAFRESLGALDPTIVHDALVPWLRRAGQQLSEETTQGGKFWSTANKFARSVRNNAALQIMSANSVVLLEQLTHFPSVFVRVDKGKMASAVWNYMWHPSDMTKAIQDQSPFMATRESAALTEARTEINKILLDPTVFQNVRQFSQTHGRFLMAGVQSVMDHVTWQAMYDQSVERGMTDKEATREADATVRELLGSYTPEDVSRIEAGTPIQRLFTMFYGFFNTKANVLETEATIAQQVGLKKGSGRLTGAAFWGFMIPAFMGAAIKDAMGSQPYFEDDEGTLHALLRHFGLSQLEMAGRMVPFAGNAVAVGEAAFGHGRQDQLLNSPAIKMFSDATFGSLKDAYDLSQGAELKSKHITDLFTLIGMATGLPVRPFAKPIGYIHDVKTGKAEPASPADFGRGLLVGR